MIRYLALTVPLALGSAAQAEVAKSDASGFVSTHSVVIAAAPDKVWDAIVQPQLWWSKDHSYSGKAENLSLYPRPGGCWCEKLPGGGVEHGRVIYADRGKALRIDGALGPLQSGAVTGRLTFALKAEGQGTVLTLTYVVGGFHPAGLQALATPVDGVLAAQLPALKRVAETGK
jgi:uncharacterized protein YndB with AHSA1/START domain